MIPNKKLLWSLLLIWMTVCTSSYTLAPPPSCHYNFIPQQSTARQNQLVYFRSHGINCTRNKLKLLILFACYVISSCKVRPSVRPFKEEEEEEAVQKNNKFDRTLVLHSSAPLLCLWISVGNCCRDSVVVVVGVRESSAIDSGIGISQDHPAAAAVIVEEIWMCVHINRICTGCTLF